MTIEGTMTRAKQSQKWKRHLSQFQPPKKARTGEKSTAPIDNTISTSSRWESEEEDSDGPIRTQSKPVRCCDKNCSYWLCHKCYVRAQRIEDLERKKEGNGQSVARRITWQRGHQVTDTCEHSPVMMLVAQDILSYFYRSHMERKGETYEYPKQCNACNKLLIIEDR
jgi:hypothetical protein